MSEPKQTEVAEFDHYSDGYRKLLDESVGITGETSEYFAAYKANYVDSRVVQKPGGKILDHGCGIGSLAGLLKAYLSGATVDGYDVSARNLSKIDKALVNQGRFTSRLDELAYDYDLVVVANVLHHIAAELRQATVAQIAARVAPSGQIVIFEHNPLNPMTRWAVARCPFDENAVLLSTRETLGYLRQIGMRIMRRDYMCSSHAQ